MRAGERKIIGGRYELSRVAGSGGAGRVYQAVDLITGSIVAVKLLMDHYGSDVERFKREAAVLEGLRHDGVVRYLDHGESEDGRPFLVMEWLDGVTLADALDEDFGIARSVALMKRLASALAYAHRQGVVHRDLKPSNVFLVGGRVELAKLIDFGLALGPGLHEQITGTGVPVGTPAYMAPEVVQGHRGGTPSADVFSLGSLFYRCLTGQAPFSGPNVMALLAKVVVAQPPSVRDLRPLVPASIERVVARMMQKDPTDRFRDASELLGALGDAEARVREELEHASSSSSLGMEERKLISVLMADGVGGDEGLDLTPLARRYMSEVQRLASGQLVFTFGGAGEASDLVARAARCALELRRIYPDAAFSVMTGPGDPRRRVPGGDVIDSAAIALGEARGAGNVVLDLTTTNLLEGRFVTRQAGSRFFLEAFREADEPGRELLGRATPFVGRKRELRMALSCFEGVIEDRTSSVLVVTGQAGIGKSRLREELVAQMARSAASPQILVGRPDAVHGGAFDLARRIFRAAAGIRPEFPAIAAQALARARLERVLEPSEVHEHTVLLGELIGAPFESDAEVGIAVVRSDKKLLGDRMRAAFGRWLAAEARAHPTVLVLEELEHADAVSLELVEEAVRQAKGEPLFVLGIARPSIVQTNPGAFRELRGAELHLGPLPEAAILELAQAVANDIDGLESDSLAERSGGNPLLVEELIRAAAAGRSAGAPQSVLALLQSRFESLPLPVRRVARLASVFGDQFTKSAVGALAGEGLEGALEAERALQSLVEHDVVERTSLAATTPPGYRFRSSYWREAAYSTFVDADRVAAHRAAGEYLERRGGASPLELALHFEQGRDARAGEAYAKAAALALAGGDVKTALSYVDRGVSLDVEDEVFGRLRQIEAEAQKWAGSNDLVVEAARDALEKLPWGSHEWLAVLGELAAAEGKMGNPASVFMLGDTLDSTPHAEGLEGVRAIAAARIAMQMAFSGDPCAASVILERNARDEASLDPVSRGYVLESRAIIAGVHGHKGDRVRYAERAAEAFDEGRDHRNAALLGGSVGFALNEVGLYERAKATLARAIELADSVGANNAATVARAQLARSMLRTGERTRGQMLLREAIRELIEQKNARLEGVARVYLAESLLEEGELDEARVQVARAVSLLELAAPLLAPALAVSARVRLREGELEEAVRLVDRAADIVRNVSVPSGEGMVRRARIEVLEGAGMDEEARASRARAKAWLEARVAELEDTELAQAFVAISEHREIAAG